MNDSTQRITDLMNSISDQLEAKTITPLQAEALFKQQVSKNDLLQSLTDKNMDLEDIEACKEMLKHFYGHEQDIN